MYRARSGTYPLALLTAGHFFSDFYANFLPALLPVIIAGLGLSITAGGFLVTVYTVAACVLQPVCGYYIDRGSYGWLLLVTLPVSAAAICLTGLAPGYAALVALVAVAGVASSAFHPLASSLINKLTPDENKGLAMSLFIGGGTFGFGLAPIIVIYYLLEFGQAALPWLVVPALMLTVVFYACSMHRVALAPAGPAPAAVAWYKSGPLLKLNVVMALRSWSQVALPSFLPVWLAQQGQAPTLAGGLLTAYLLAGTAGGFVLSWLGDRFGHRNCIIFSLVVCLPAMYLFLRSPEVTLSSWLLLALSGALTQGTVPSSVVLAQEMAPGNAAMAAGMMMGLAYGFGGLGVGISGALADVIGLQAALLWSVAPLGLAIPLACTIADKKPLPIAD